MLHAHTSSMSWSWRVLLVTNSMRAVSHIKLLLLLLVVVVLHMHTIISL
jgi:hypothetical protein